MYFADALHPRRCRHLCADVMVYPLYEAKPEPKELWIVPGATHAMSYKDYPQEYTEHVKKFVGKYIH